MKLEPGYPFVQVAGACIFHTFGATSALSCSLPQVILIPQGLSYLKSSQVGLRISQIILTFQWTVNGLKSTRPPLAVHWLELAETGCAGIPRARPQCARWVRPHPPAGGPSGRRGLRPWAQTFPSTCTQSVLHSMGRGPSGTPGGLITSPPRPRPPQLARAGTPCGDRPAAGPAGREPGPARTGLSTVQ